MKKIKSIISILLSIVLLLSSISVGSIVSFAEGTTLTKIENTFDDDGVVYTTISMDSLWGSERTVNGVPDANKFSVWGTTIENYSEDNNAVKFISADTATSSYPAVVKIYDNNTEDKAQFKPKANTSYSIKLRYMVTDACTDRDLIFQLRQVNNPKPDRYTYSDADILISNLATITKNTTTDNWVEASATFTTSSTPEYLYLNLHSTNYRKDFVVWVDNIVIEERYDVTVNNYTPNQNKIIGMAQGSKVSNITVPAVSGCVFDGIYADADYTVPLSADTVIDSYANGTIYFKWVKLTPQQYFCGFENYSQVLVSSYDKAVAALVSDTVYNGSKAMKTALQSNGITAFEIRDKEAFNITKGTNYEVSFSYKSDADAEISVGLAKATDVCGTAVAYATTSVSATDSWQTAKLTITADKGTSEAYALAMLIFAENGANIYIDDILVTDMTELEMVNMPTVSTDTYPTLGEVKEIWDGTVATEFAGGTGTEADPYLISNGKQLALAITQSGTNETYYGKCFKITKDIYLNDINAVDWTTGTKNTGYKVNSWYDYYCNDDGTITDTIYQDFAGVIDGAGFTVYGLYYKHGESINYAGLPQLASGLIPGISKNFNSKVSNLCVDYAYVHHKFTAGIIVGSSYASDVTISNSFIGENVKVSAANAGAFVGACSYLKTMTLTNCYSFASYATVAANYGLAAYLYNSTSIIKNCYNANGPLTSYSASNYNTKYKFYNSYETITSGNATSSDALKTNVYQITTENMQGTDVFTNEEKMPYLALNTNGSANTAYTATKGYPVLTSFVKESVKENSIVWDGTVSETLVGQGTEASPFLINSGGDLAYAITSGGGNDKYYKLTSDIYLNDATDFNLNTGYTYDTGLNQWYFNQAFAGTIDGDGHTVYGLYYRNENIPSKGYLSNLYGAGLVPKVTLGATVTIKNLSIDKSYVANVYYASAFVGLSGENVSSSDKAVVNIENCYVGSQVKIEGYYAGSFLGGSRNGNITIANSYSLATTEGSTGHGLVCGLWDSTAKISNCYNTNGPIKSVNDGTVTLTNCYETETSVRGTAELRTKENMKGSDVLTNADKMSKLGSAFVLTDDSSLDDYYIYLPAGTVFEEEYNVNCFDTFFVPLNNSDVINSAGIVTRGAYISFNEAPDATKIVIPADVYDFVRFGTMLELAAKDTYYGDRMNVIRKTLDSEPKNAVNYIFITDIHYSNTYFLKESLRNQLELIVKTANEDDSIDFVCIGGDSINGSAGTKDANLQELNAVFTPLLDCKKPVFIIQGNHDDGSYKKAPFYIKEMFSHKDWKEEIIDKYVNRTLPNETEIKVVDNSENDNGNAKYYYYDLKNKNTRVIVLDTNDYYMEYDKDGTVTALEIRDASKDDTDHLKYNCAYTYSGYRQEQLKWLAKEALGNLPEGYDVTFLSHMELKRWNSTSETYTYNGDEIIELIGAYQNKTSFTNTNLGINVDYSATQGKVLTFQYGHTHSDKTQYDSNLNLININTTQGNGLASRVLYSETEARFDVMSVTKDSVYRLTVGTTGTTRKIYYAIDTESGDLNFDSSVDICDLVYADLIKDGKKGITTAADIDADGALEADILLAVRKLLLGK